ncbi:myeloid differentiation primary response protein MyD88-like [Littorina saxatilis]
MRRFHSDNGPQNASPLSQSYDAARATDQKFDFYLAVPDEDLEDFGIPFCRMVERRMNLKPCMTIRDVELGPKYETMAHTLETKCGGKVVFVVSKHFPKSDECQFLVHFAKTLDPDAKCARLIPLEIDKNVRLPHVLEGLCKIHYNAAVRENWLGERLWLAIKGGQRPPRYRSISSSAP